MLRRHPRPYARPPAPHVEPRRFNCMQCEDTKVLTDPCGFTGDCIWCTPPREG